MWLDSIQYQYVNAADFHILRPQGNGFWTCAIAHGPVCFECGGEEMRIIGNHMILYEPDVRQHFYATGTEYLHDWFHLHMDEADLSFFRSLEIPVNIPVPLVDLAPLSSLIRLTAISFQSQEPRSAEICHHLLQAFFLKAANLIREADVPVPQARHYSAMAALRDEIQSFPYRSWTLVGEARRMGLSPSYFQHTYRRLMDRPFSEDVIESRIRYAKALLRRSDDTIASIAALCGYSSEFHFMRQFKKRTGLTPTIWRQSQTD